MESHACSVWINSLGLNIAKKKTKQNKSKTSKKTKTKQKVDQIDDQIDHVFVKIQTKLLL